MSLFGILHRVILSRVIYFLHCILLVTLVFCLLFLNLVHYCCFLSLIHKEQAPPVAGSTITLVSFTVVPMSQDGSARLDLPAGGQEELGGVSHSERMMADMMMLANLTIQNQQLLQQHLQQTAAAAGDRGVQQQIAGAADNRGLQQQMAAEDGGRVQESGGAQEGRDIDSSGPLVRETPVKQESCPAKDDKQAWREATRVFGSLVKHP